MKKALDKLKSEEAKARKITDPRKLAFFYKDYVRPVMDDLRAPADNLEMLVDKNDWPFPTYADLLFEG
jgi:glutamine synthetase